MQVPIHPHEGLLDQVLGSLAVSHGAVDEVHEPVVVPPDQLAEGTLLAVEESLHDLAVGELLQLATTQHGLAHG